MKGEEISKTTSTLKKQLSKFKMFLFTLRQFGRMYGFTHNDLHVGNVMVNKETGALTMIDYGQCHFIDPPQLAKKTFDGFFNQARDMIESSLGGATKSGGFDLYKEISDGLVATKEPFYNGKISYELFASRFHDSFDYVSTCSLQIHLVQKI